ncbi:MAG: MBOAT family O-acyltransferase, partial [Bacteroidia bacterium]
MMQNFNSPFSSTNMTEFWRKWHISLSTWFSDYLFTPLTISFRDWGKKGIALALFITFFFSGLWHGPSWTFVLYGCMHGVAIIFEMYTKKTRKKVSQLMPAVLYDNLSRLLTFCYVTISWVVFRSDSFGKMKEMLKKLFGLEACGTEHLPVAFLYVLLPLILFISMDVLLYKKQIGAWMDEKPFWLRWSIYAVFIATIFCISGLDTKPFIYFQF